MPDLPAAEMRPVFFVQKSAKKIRKNKNSVYWIKKGWVENGKEKAKK